MNSSSSLIPVDIIKLVYGGRGIGELPNGKKVFVWNSLPGERVGVRVIASHNGYDEGIAEKIIKSSEDRENPVDNNFLATSPWQIMSFEAENRYKINITHELLQQLKVNVPVINGPTFDERKWHYRNKMEFSFSNHENRLRLAVRERNSHALQVVEGSSLAMPNINQAANDMCICLTKAEIKNETLSTIIVRSSQNNKIAASLYVMNKSFPRLIIPKIFSGLRVYYTESVKTKSKVTNKLYELGDCSLEDKLLNNKILYDVDSFFQINVPIFELAIKQIKDHCQSSEIVDTYAGVGSIGLNVVSKSVDLIELNSDMVKIARVNAERLGVKARVLKASTDNALEYIVPNKTIIFDPPRSGLHDKILSRILATRPLKIAYLSCNPATQARDLYRLQSAYNIVYFEVFNFFPRTPEIETLAILDAK